ncbi:cytochrome c [Parvibaculum lavamentivorans DS-1]|uniref:Cytochrome c n=1 Tax=Parvibaculum lavamentivorans (strain DS-1 / DSM 13023 / NCIMB 13966) TaxID=402881 RepID=A7HTX7_PARL1|nr:c-type cytochrome [Parvibaculum lavamentivorans]ABS63360.1 cytochrome c [Parvibaculum lavamentivorans DS-1]
MLDRGWCRAVLAGLALTALAGCGEEQEAAAPVVLDTQLAALYEHSCSTCHEDPATGAPPAHDEAAWAPRIAKGETQLLDNIVNGFNGMPPLGQCIECDAGDFMTLTRFMASPAPASAKGESEE